MPSTFTANINLELQATGENSGTWGSLLNANDFTIVDSVLGAVQTLSLSGSDITVTTPQSQVNFIKLTGALTANVNVIFPAIGRSFFVQNGTTGAFAVTMKIAGSGAVAVVPKNGGAGQSIVLDGVNVYADFGGAPPGKVDEFAMTAVPFGWLLCDGSAVSRSTYAALFLAIGTTYGAGNGSTTFNIPNALGYFSRAWNGTGSGPDAGRAIGSTQAAAFASHTHGVTDPGHDHDVPTKHGLNTDGTAISSYATNGPPVTFSTAKAATGISIQSTGGTETRPINIAFARAIKW